MGSKTGKYAVGNGETMSTSLPSNTDAWMEGSQVKTSKSSFPTLLRRNSLADASSSTDDNNTSLVWLDTELHNQPSHIDTQIKLKNVINYLRTFVDVDTCERYIEQIGRMNEMELLNEELLVIISPTLALTLIEHFHDLPPVKAMYIYGASKTSNQTTQQLLKRYPKVKGIYSTTQSLLARIIEDQKH